MDNRAKLILKNTVFLYLRLFITLVIGLVTSRVVLKTLGAEDFGIYNLVGGIVTIFAFVNQSLSSSTQRFITFDLGRGDYGSLKKSFSTALNVHMLYSVIIIFILELFGLIFLTSALNIDSDRMYAAKWVFHCMVVSSVLGIMRAPFTAIITANERFNFYAIVGIVEPLLKLLILYVLLIVSFDKLILYSILYLFVTLISTLMYVIYVLIKLRNQIGYRVKLKLSEAKKFIKFTGLNLYEQIAVVCSYQGVDFLLNIFHGVIVNAAMGIAKQVQAAVFNFVSGFQSAMSPQITKSYAAGDFAYLSKLMVAAPKYSLLLILILTLPVMFNIEALLSIWLGEYPVYTKEFCCLILVSCILESISLPYRTLVYAEGKIVKYQLVIGTCFLLNLILSYVFLMLGYSPQVVLYVRILVYLLIDIIRLCFFRKYCVGSFVKYILNTYGHIVILLILAFPLLYIVNSFFNPNLLLRLVCSVLVVLLLTYMVGINNLERRVLINYLKQKITKL